MDKEKILQFINLQQQYKQMFGDDAPVHIYGRWPTPGAAFDMVKTAVERGTPIVDSDYPIKEDDIDY